MKRTGVIIVLGALFLTGCGGSSAPIAAGCSTRLLRSGLMQARVTVKNGMGNTHRAVIYGPALRRVRYIHPVLKTVDVVVHVGSSAQSYPGWLLPGVSPDTASTVVFRLVRPTHARSILAAPGPSVKLDSWDALSNGDCTVG